MPAIHRELVSIFRDNVKHRTRDRLQLMVLGDDESMEELLNALLTVLKPGGLLLFRHDIGSDACCLSGYTHLLDTYRSVTVTDANGNQAGFQFLFAQSLNTAIHERQSWSDVVWALRKDFFAPSSDAHLSVRDFLDKSQYTNHGINAYEYIFGEGFISPGGAESNAEFVARAGLKPAMKVLDVGCGIGGNLFHVAQEYGSDVIGVDLSSNMLSLALQRANVVKNTRIELLVADVMKHDFEENSLDVIYSRDCIIHIEDKVTLFNRFHVRWGGGYLKKWLKVGGVVVMTDYNVGEEKNFTAEFKAYLENRQYGLKKLSDYVQAFKSAGFHNVEGVDITEKFRDTLNMEIARAETHKTEFINRFSEEQYKKLVSGWHQKLVFIQAGCHKWGKYYAQKL